MKETNTIKHCILTAYAHNANDASFVEYLKQQSIQMNEEDTKRDLYTFLGSKEALSKMVEVYYGNENSVLDAITIVGEGVSELNDVDLIIRSLEGSVWDSGVSHEIMNRGLGDVVYNLPNRGLIVSKALALVRYITINKLVNIERTAIIYCINELELIVNSLSEANPGDTDALIQFESSLNNVYQKLLEMLNKKV